MSDKQDKNESARSRKEQIVDDFEAFCDERDASGDWQKYVARGGDKLNRTEIAKELGFARSVWGSNDVLSEKLNEREAVLRSKDILTSIQEVDTKSIKAESDRRGRFLSQSNSRVKSLEQQLAAVTVERDDLKRRVDRLEFLEHHMMTTGRVPN